MSNKTYGFTIVELLIVIVVIGILAAISIVAFNGISNQADDTAVKSDLANNAKKIEMYRTTAADGLYPTSPNPSGIEAKLKFSKKSYSTTNNAALYCQDNSQTTFALWSRSKSGKMFAVTNNSPVTEVTGSTSNVATCPNNRVWIHAVDMTTPDKWLTWVE